MSSLALIVVLKLAYIGVGLVFSLIGKALVEKKIESDFEGKGKFGKNSIQVITKSSGSLFLLAGLAIIAATIFQSSELIETFKAQTIQENNSSSQDNKQLKADGNLGILVERSRRIRFANSAGLNMSIDELLRQAERFVKIGETENAAVFIAIAVVSNPGSLGDIINNPSFKAVLENPQLKTIINQRFNLPIIPISIPSSTISPVVENILSRLESLAKWDNPETVKSEMAAEKVKLIPSGPGIQSKEETVAILIASLEFSAKTTLLELKKMNRRWILDDPEILDKIEIYIERKISND